VGSPAIALVVAGGGGRCGYVGAGLRGGRAAVVGAGLGARLPAGVDADGEAAGVPVFGVAQLATSATPTMPRPRRKEAVRGVGRSSDMAGWYV
jgi:hypothetical protein